LYVFALAVLLFARTLWSVTGSMSIKTPVFEA